MKKLFTILSLLVFSTMVSTAQNEKIVKFYDTKVGSGYHSIGSDFGFIGDTLMLFQMWSDECGYELWRTNGTSVGTYMLKDINPTFDSYGDPLYSSPEYFSRFNNEVYFRATDGEHGYELWKTDGTEEGTVMVKDIYPGAAGSMNPTSSTHFVEYNGELYFAAKAGNDTGLELWKTDGTEEGTVQVKDIYLEDGKSSNPSGFVVFNDLLFFTAETSSYYPEIWYTDGTIGSAFRLSELPKEQTPKAKDLMVFNGMLIFKGELDNGLEFWKTDGTSEGTEEIKDINPGVYAGAPSDELPVELNGYLYFRGSSADGYELWKTDGTTDGTLMVKDINPGMNGSSPYSSSPTFLCVFDNKVFFAARNEDSGTQLWASDGTEAGTLLYYGNSNDGTWNPRNLQVHNNRFYFTINTSAFGQPYLYSIGTSSETPVAHQPKDFTFKTYERTYGSFFRLNNTLCFQAELEENTGFELYKLEKEDVTGISEVEDAGFNVYPNPTTDFVRIDFVNNQNNTVYYAVYDIEGKLVSQQEKVISGTLKIDFSGFNKGVYLVKITTNSKTYSKTVVCK